MWKHNERVQQTDISRNLLENNEVAHVIIENFYTRFIGTKMPSPVVISSVQFFCLFSVSILHNFVDVLVPCTFILLLHTHKNDFPQFCDNS